MVQIKCMFYFALLNFLINLPYSSYVLVDENRVWMPRVAASSKELTVLFVLYTIVFYFRMYRDGKRYLADIPRQMKLGK